MLSKRETKVCMYQMKKIVWIGIKLVAENFTRKDTLCALKNLQC